MHTNAHGSRTFPLSLLFFRSASSPQRNAWRRHRRLLSSRLQKRLVLVSCALKFASCLLRKRPRLRSYGVPRRSPGLLPFERALTERCLIPSDPFTFLQSATSSWTRPHSFECVTSEDASSPVVGPLTFPPSLPRAHSSNVEHNRWFIFISKPFETHPQTSRLLHNVHKSQDTWAHHHTQALFKLAVLDNLNTMPENTRSENKPNTFDLQFFE